MPKERAAEHPGKLLYFSSGIYGAGPSGRAWYESHIETCQEHGCLPLKSEPSICCRCDERGTNVDDGIVLATDQQLIDDFRAFYDSKYQVRWGDITRYGGVNVTIDDEHGTLSLDQHFS